MQPMSFHGANASCRTMPVVDEAEKALKMKIRPINAFLKCYKLELLSALPREELHQFAERIEHWPMISYVNS